MRPYIFNTFVEDNTDGNRSLSRTDIPVYHILELVKANGQTGMSVLLRQSLHELIHFFRGVVKMGRNSQPVTARSSDDVLLLKVRVQIH